MLGGLYDDQGKCFLSDGGHERFRTVHERYGGESDFHGSMLCESAYSIRVKRDL